MKRTTLETARKLKKVGVTLDDIIEMLEDVGEKTPEDEDVLEDIMREAGITANYLGYRYLIETVKITSESPKNMKLHGDVYPKVANKLNVIPDSVERCIRHCASLTWKRNPDFCKKILGEKMMKKPTNSEFIAAISQYYKRKTKNK